MVKVQANNVEDVERMLESEKMWPTITTREEDSMSSLGLIERDDLLEFLMRSQCDKLRQVSERGYNVLALYHAVINKTSFEVVVAAVSLSRRHTN